MANDDNLPLHVRTIDPDTLPEAVFSIFTLNAGNRYRAVPIQVNPDKETVVLAIEEGSYFQEILQRVASPYTVEEFRQISPDNMSALLERWKRYEDRQAQDRTAAAIAEEFTDRLDADQLTADASMVSKLVISLLERAADLNASDIFLLYDDKGLVCDIKVNGLKRFEARYERSVAEVLIGNLKIRSTGIRREQDRLPQSGSFSATLDSGDYDFRVQTIPGTHGEGMVIRVLPQDTQVLSLAQLGLSKEVINRFTEAIRARKGMFIVAGRTGGGKSTTLHAGLVLKHQLDPAKQIYAVEDPVERQLEGITQISISDDIGFTFAIALRMLLRAAPDIILIGEIRDPETARRAVEFANTGHLVLTTVHTNSAADVPGRLRSFGIKNFDINSTLKGALFQDLLPVLCDNCKIPYTPNKNDLISAGWQGATPKTLYHRNEEGCMVCDKTGYIGQTAVGELMKINRELADAILEGADTYEIQDKALKAGMIPLQTDALAKVKEGIVDIIDAVGLVSELQEEASDDE